MPAMNAVVRARIDEGVKAEAEAVLSQIGLTASDAFRLLMVRTAAEKRLPFELLQPNAETIAAINEARSKGGTERFATAAALMADLHADD